MKFPWYKQPGFLQASLWFCWEVLHTLRRSLMLCWNIENIFLSGYAHSHFYSVTCVTLYRIYYREYGEVPVQLLPATPAWLICLCFHLYAWTFPKASLPLPPQFSCDYLQSPARRLSTPAPCKLTLHFFTTGKQCSENGPDYHKVPVRVTWGQLQLLDMFRWEVLAMGPLRCNCFRQMKEVGGRICSCALHLPGSRSAGIISWGGRDRAASFLFFF